jgi:hypothetical protein
LRIEYDWPTIGCFVLLAIACVGCGYAVQGMPLVGRLATYLALSLAYPLAGFLLLARSPIERERMRILLAKVRFRSQPLGGVGQ